MEVLASSKDEVVMMLGHGTEHGLLCPNDQCQFGRFIISDKHVDLLREHVCIGIWCNANRFAETHGLNGLFSGMVISEEEEAHTFGVDLKGEDLNERNHIYATDLAYCLRHYSLDLVPDAMQNVKDYSSPLNDFNYSSLYCYGKTSKTLDY